MRLSAVIPSYNHASYLHATLDSVFAQAVPFDEIVVSDNHSTDDTASILAEYGDSVRVVRPPRHLRMSEHWNFAFSAVQAEWAVLLSSDDLAAPCMSEVLRRGVARREDAVYVRGGHDVIDEAGRRVARRYLLSVRPTERPPRTVLEQLDGPKAALCAGAVRLDAWRAVEGFPTTVTLLGDWGMWLRLASLGTFAYERRIVASYRAGHQDDLGPERALPYMRDLVVIDQQLIPQAAQAVGLSPDDPRVRRASVRRLLRLLSWFAAEASAADRAVAAAELEPWASRVGCVHELARLERGLAPASALRAPILRSRLVPPLRAAYTWWRG